MRRAAALCLAVTLAPACNELLGIPAASLSDESTVDGGGTEQTMPDMDGNREPHSPSHLLLTEINATGVSGEFVEIYNPLPEAVELRDYYLTDEPTYYLIPRYVRLGTPPAVGNRDVIVRFPEGSSLPPGGVIAIAVNEDGFRSEFSQQPDYTIVPSPVDPTAPPVEIVAQGNIPMEITDSGEAIILFWWDGQSDLVTDVDIALVGESQVAPGNDNGQPSKTGQLVDGPDDDTMATGYQPDSASMVAAEKRHSGTYRRLAREQDHEIMAGGNGVAGHDETSEDIQATWDQETNVPPSPGTIEF